MIDKYLSFKQSLIKRRGDNVAVEQSSPKRTRTITGGGGAIEDEMLWFPWDLVSVAAREARGEFDRTGPLFVAFNAEWMKSMFGTPELHYKKFMIGEQMFGESDPISVQMPPMTSRFAPTPLTMLDFDTQTQPDACTRLQEIHGVVIERDLPAFSSARKDHFARDLLGEKADVAALCRLNFYGTKPDPDDILHSLQQNPDQQRLRFVEQKASQAELYNEVYRLPGLQLEDEPYAPSRYPPFPSTLAIPSSFRFLVHMTTSDPATWDGYNADPALDTRELRVPATVTGLNIFPGVYTTLVTDDNIHTLETYIGKFIILLSLDLLKQRNWHINMQDMAGRIGENTTFFSWQQDEIESHIRHTAREGSFNELIFHDPIPLRKFAVSYGPLNPQAYIHGSPEHQEIMKSFLQHPRELLNLPLSELNPALPAYCFLPPNPTKPEKMSHWYRHAYYGPSSHAWREQLYETCRMRYAPSSARELTRLHHAIVNELDVNAAEISKPTLLQQVNFMRLHRDLQNFTPLLGPRPNAQSMPMLDAVEAAARLRVAKEAAVEKVKGITNQTQRENIRNEMFAVYSDNPMRDMGYDPADFGMRTIP